MTTDEPGVAGRPGALRQPREIRSMFDRIVPRYDLMNRLMSLGMDLSWRRKAARIAIGAGADRVLDVATGTGDLALELARQGVPDVVGLDFSGRMLDSARTKTIRTARGTISLVQGDAMMLPFPDASFDAVTIAFGLRNLPDYQAGIVELARVLRPEGRLVILETTVIRQPLLRSGYQLYFDRLVPILGGALSGDRDAYSYLPRSAGVFPPAEALADRMRAAGLRNVRYLLFSFGTIALHVGIKR